MEIGVGLPGHVTGVEERTLLTWARRAEERGFASLIASDRLAWSTPDPLITLAAAAGATERIRLVTSVLLAPLHTNPALFAKAAATLDRIAGAGRLHLGLAPGAREDDYRASHLDFRTRGRALDALVERVTAIWRGEEEVGPAPVTPGGPPLWFGGTSQATLRRVASHGTGWIAGTDGDIEEFLAFATRLHHRWKEAGRQGRPRIRATAMFALGDHARPSLARAVTDYYAFAGPDYVRTVIDTAATTADAVHAVVTAYEAAGLDELVFVGNATDPRQIDLLADVLGDRLASPDRTTGGPDGSR
ncbi:LLM class flavin-dependent oxidoreductase [Streptomyces sp. NRRL F-5630]|uniref:LLM class flavin-dependent oxidoreductase n=1 Tax=Streptomyces sp. NRRL F-5630 TaxID=1463864 RepID=UPI003EBBF052